MITVQEVIEIVTDINNKMHDMDDHCIIYEVSVEAFGIYNISINFRGFNIWDSDIDENTNKETVKNCVVESLDELFKSFALHHKGLNKPDKQIEPELTNVELEWIYVALKSGYDKGFSSRPTKCLNHLCELGLIERNPCSHGKSTQWRITQKGEDEYRL